MKRYIDEATIGIVLLVLYFFLIFYASILRKNFKLFVLVFILGFLILIPYFFYLKYKSTANIVKNDYDNSVKYLDEHGNLKELPAGRTVSGVDGVNTCTHTGKVFKAHNGVNLKVTKTGDLKEVNFLSRLYNRSGGGWVSKDFFSEYDLLNQWQQLFLC